MMQTKEILFERRLQSSNNSTSSGGSGPTGIDGTIALVAIFVILFCMIWMPARLRRCRLHGHQRDAFMAASELMELEAQIVRDTLRRMDMNRNSSLRAELRKRFIAEALVTKKVRLASAEETEKEASTETRPPSSRHVHTDSSHIDMACKEGENADDQCAICLTHYENGDEVCYSTNPECPHFFHRACMEEWLINHYECPCCRVRYLLNEEEYQNQMLASEADGNIMFARGLSLFAQLQLAGAAAFPNRSEATSSPFAIFGPYVQRASSDAGTSTQAVHQQDEEMGAIQSEGVAVESEEEIVVVPQVDIELQNMDLSSTDEPSVPVSLNQSEDATQ